MAKLTLKLPVAIADEIEAAARRCERSVGFLVLGALKADSRPHAAPDGARGRQGAGAPGGAVPGDRRAMEVTTGEDDPRDLGTRLKKLAADKKLSLEDAVALAWTARRAAILAWVDKIAAVDVKQQADDLDEGLRRAADPKTPPAELVALAGSDYVKVRVLVAENPSSPKEALARLGEDKDRVVREALENRRLAGG